MKSINAKYFSEFSAFGYVVDFVFFPSKNLLFQITADTVILSHCNVFDHKSILDQFNERTDYFEEQENTINIRIMNVDQELPWYYDSILNGMSFVQSISTNHITLANNSSYFIGLNDQMPSYLKEFNDFVIPCVVPQGFIDQSWHNDAYPTFLNEKYNIVLGIDYPQEKSELQDMDEWKKFNVCLYGMDDLDQSSEPEMVFCSNDFNKIERKIKLMIKKREKQVDNSFMLMTHYIGSYRIEVLTDDAEVGYKKIEKMLKSFSDNKLTEPTLDNDSVEICYYELNKTEFL